MIDEAYLFEADHRSSNNAVILAISTTSGVKGTLIDDHYACEFSLQSGLLLNVIKSDNSNFNS